MSDTRTRAAAVLGVSENATCDEAIIAFLSALPTAGCLPTGERVMAVNMLANTGLPCDSEPEFLTGFGLRGAVDDFIKRFWSLAPATRLAEWKALSSCGGDNPHVNRLLALSPGLEVSSEPLADPLAEEIAVLIRELFLLPARARAVRRNEWLLTTVSLRAELVRAAEALRRAAPAIAALEPLLLARLDPKFDAAVFSIGANAQTLTEKDAAEMVETVFATPSRLPDQPDPYEQRDARNAGRILVGGCSIPFVLYLLAVVVRALGGLSSGTREGTTRPEIKSPSPSYTTPSYPLQSPSRIGYSEQEVQSFREYEATIVGGAPARYRDWVLAGKPEASHPIKQAIPFDGNLAFQRVYFSETDIRRFTEFERAPRGAPPTDYDKWVKAGKPTVAGSSLILTSKQTTLKP